MPATTDKPPSLAKELAALERMTAAGLRDTYAAVFGEPAASDNRTWLARRVGWRLSVAAGAGGAGGGFVVDRVRAAGRDPRLDLAAARVEGRRGAATDTPVRRVGLAQHAEHGPRRHPQVPGDVRDRVTSARSA
ncbi:MAG: hypothetical protein U0804_14000 [Gemmataceae bacterium]